MFRAFFLTLLFLPLFARSEILTPPPGSWEHWIQTIKSDAPKGLPSRPDKLALFEPLPIWVDCHLSYYFDKPSKTPKSKISKKIVLRSNPKDCKGALEEKSL